MFLYVYILKNKVGDLYIGFTKDPKRRLAEHNSNLNISTKNKGPWNIIHYEAYRNEKDARRREQYLKTSQGSRLLKRMLKEYFYEQRSQKQ